MPRKFGFSFSWKRALGISNAKAKLSRSIGIPLTRSGRERKIGRIVSCAPYVLFILLVIGAIALALPRLL